MPDLAVPVPERVVAGVRARWPDRADAWVRAVTSELPELCGRHDAVPRRVYSARYGYVVAADTPRGGIVLRSTPDPSGPQQAQVAAALADLGAGPALYEITTTETGTWTVMDEVRPGTPLPEVDPSRIDPEALIAPIRRIRDQPAPTGLPSVIDWLRGRLEADHLADLAPGTTVAPAEQRRHALTLLDKLAQDHEPALCHGDASGWNLLADHKRGWLLIDPRGVSGEAAYDVAVLAFKIAGRPDSSVVGLLAKLAGVSVVRVETWVGVVAATRV